MDNEVALGDHVALCYDIRVPPTNSEKLSIKHQNNNSNNEPRSPQRPKPSVALVETRHSSRPDTRRITRGHGCRFRLNSIILTVRRHLPRVGREHGEELTGKLSDKETPVLLIGQRPVGFTPVQQARRNRNASPGLRSGRRPPRSHDVSRRRV
jgi:hypothetical protein